MRTFVLFTAVLLIFAGANGVNAEPIDSPNQSQAEKRGAQSPSSTRRQRGRRPGGNDNSLAAGEIAPEFRLKSLDGKDECQLSTLRAKKPVILFFGSYT